MIQTINFYDFEVGFKLHHRGHHFSYSGLRALFDYFEELEKDAGYSLEFDPVAISCEYTEYYSIEDFWCDYDQEDYPDIDAINDETVLIMIDEDSFIIQAF